MGCNKDHVYSIYSSDDKSIQWSFLVPLIGGRWYITPQLAVYTTYILAIGWLYVTYHLLREPGNSIDIPVRFGVSMFHMRPRLCLERNRPEMFFFSKIPWMNGELRSVLPIGCWVHWNIEVSRMKCKFKSGWWQLKICFFMFTPNLGEDVPNLTIIFFQTGWFNHQLGKSSGPIFGHLGIS